MSNPNQLEPGDLALIIKSTDGLSIGKIVECVEIAGRTERLGIIWLVKSSRHDLVTEYGGISNDFHVAQDWLKKIPRDPLPDEEDVFSLDDAITI